MRYAHFGLSAAAVAALYYGWGYTLVQRDPEGLAAGMGTAASLGWFAAGNAAYYALGIAMAAAMKDNRAFCKYLCPVAVFLKIGARGAAVKIRGDREKCTDCGKCAESCPMGIDVAAYAREGTRVASTECILCMQCVAECPAGALGATAGLDWGGRERLRKRCEPGKSACG